MSKSVSALCNLTQSLSSEVDNCQACPLQKKPRTDSFAQTAYKHWVRALSRWPKDSLRPECQFQDVMKKRLDRRFLPVSSPDAAKAARAVPNSAIDEKIELEQANALYSLLENRYSQRVCECFDLSRQVDADQLP